MSTFAIFGTTMLIAKEKAEKQIKALKNQPDDFQKAVNEKAEALLQKMRPVQISPAYDAPQFCTEWLEVAARQTTLGGVRLMCRIKEDGRTKTGKPKTKLVWRPYDPIKGVQL